VRRRSYELCQQARRAACVSGVSAGATVWPFLSDAPSAHLSNTIYNAISRIPTFSYDTLLQILDKLLGEGIDIVVAGDSMMRQNYLRLVQLMRGKQRIFDYRVRPNSKP